MYLEKYTLSNWMNQLSKYNEFGAAKQIPGLEYSDDMLSRFL